MRKFRREKEPIEMNNEEFSSYLESSEPVLGNNTEPQTKLYEQKSSVQKDVKNEIGYNRVKRAARALFPDAVSDDEALNMFMDAFEDEFLNDEAGATKAASNPLQNNNAGVDEASANTKTAEELVSSWLEDEAKLKKIIPQFSLSKAFENEEYKKLVLEMGMDLFSAYEKINPINLQNSASGVIDEVGNNTNASVPGSASSNISNASDEEFNKYIKRIMDEE